MQIVVAWAISGEGGCAPFEESLELGAPQDLQVAAQLADLRRRRGVLPDRRRRDSGRHAQHQAVARRAAVAVVGSSLVHHFRARTVQGKAAQEGAQTVSDTSARKFVCKCKQGRVRARSAAASILEHQRRATPGEAAERFDWSLCADEAGGRGGAVDDRHALLVALPVALLLDFVLQQRIRPRDRRRLCRLLQVGMTRCEIFR